MKSIHGLQLPQSLDELLDPSRLALIVYDMQIGICRQVSDAPRVVAAVSRVLEAAREASVRIIFMRHMSLPPELMGASAYRVAMAWQRKIEPEDISPWFLRGNPGFALTPELRPRPSEAVLDKITMSAFEGTPLEIILRDCAVTTVAFVGIALEVGIDPSVRHAADLGFVPVIVADACGSGDAVAAERALAAIRYAGDTVITDERAFVECLRRRA